MMIDPKVTAKLELKPEMASAKRALEELIALTQRLGAEASRAAAAMGGGPAGPGVPGAGGGAGGFNPVGGNRSPSPPGRGAGGGGGGWFSNAANAFGALGITNEIVGSASRAMSALRIFADGSLTFEEKMSKATTGLVRSIPIIGGLIGDFVDMVNDFATGPAKERMRQSRIDIEIQRGRDQVFGERESRMVDIGGQRVAADAQVRAQQRYPLKPRPINFTDFSTGTQADPYLRYGAGIVGNYINQGLGLAEAIKPDAVKAAEGQVRMAQRRFDVANEVAGYSMSRLPGLEDAVGNLQGDLRGPNRRLADRMYAEGMGINPAYDFRPEEEKKRQQIEDERRQMDRWYTGGQGDKSSPSGGSSGGESGLPLPSAGFRIDLVREEQEAQAKRMRQKDALEKQEQGIKKAQQDQVELANKAYELAKAQVEVKKAELGVIKQQEQSQRAGYESFRMKSDIDRYRILEAAKMAQKIGITQLPDDAKSLLLNSPETAQWAKNQIPQIFDNKDLKELNEITGGGADYKPTEAKRKKLEDDIDRLLDDADRKFVETTKTITTNFTGALENLSKAITEISNTIVVQQQKLQTALALLSKG